MQQPADFIQNRLAALEKVCRKAGLRVTHQRREVFRELLQSSDHPTADTLHRRLRHKFPTLSLDTVYRTLATLVSQRLVHRVETIESLTRFEAVTHPHHHLICRGCGQIADFQWPLIDQAALPEELSGWGKIEHKNLVVYGLCANCLK